MKVLRKIFEWLILLVIGFVVGLFFGPQIINELAPLEEQHQTEIPKINREIDETSLKRPTLSDFLSPYPGSVNEAYVENRVIELVNELRAELELGTVQKNNILTDAANIRAIETEESFSHTRPNGENPFTVLEESGTEYPYQMVGENLAMSTFIEDEEHMSELIMNGWINSEDHYQTMINPNYDEIGVGVHYDGEILYVTQFFGKQR